MALERYWLGYCAEDFSHPASCQCHEKKKKVTHTVNMAVLSDVQEVDLIAYCPLLLFVFILEKSSKKQHPH